MLFRVKQGLFFVKNGKNAVAVFCSFLYNKRVKKRRGEFG